MELSVLSARQRIDTLAKKAANEPVSADMELQAQLARFLCILTSGWIEQAVISILNAHTQKRSHPRVAQYVSHQLSRLQNAKFEDILVLLGRFDSLWRDHCESTTPIEIKDAIDSIVNNRNQIAHGAQVSISLGTFTKYYDSVKTFVSDLDAFISSS
jgi:hypothetical protein